MPERTGPLCLCGCGQRTSERRRKYVQSHDKRLYPYGQPMARLVPEGDCMVWPGSRISTGYGNLLYEGEWWLAHRLAWTLKHGPIPDGLNVLHRCDNPPCCNTDHLFLGTQSDNGRDMAAKDRWGNQTRPGAQQLAAGGSRV